jgi:polar amino acid transport system substrate-binding protein
MRLPIGLFTIFISLFLCLSVYSSSTPELKQITMCWHEGRPYAGSDLKDGGLVADFVTTVMKDAGFNPKILFLPWARCREGVRHKKYDMLFAMWNGVDQHIRDFDFLEPTNIERVAFFALSESKIQTSDISSLEKVHLGAHIQGGYNKELINKKNIKMVYLTSDEQKLKMLLARRVDLIISDPARIDSILNERMKSDKKKVRALYPYLRTELSSPAILKTNPNKELIIKKYSQSYKKLCRDGTLERIIKKHGFSYIPPGCDE